MSMFRKYLDVVTESNYMNNHSDDIQELINRLNDDLIEELESFNDFNDFEENSSIELRQIINKIINANKNEDKRYFILNDFESLKDFILNIFYK